MEATGHNNEKITSGEESKERERERERKRETESSVKTNKEGRHSGRVTRKCETKKVNEQTLRKAYTQRRKRKASRMSRKAKS